MLAITFFSLVEKQAVQRIFRDARNDKFDGAFQYQGSDISNYLINCTTTMPCHLIFR